jgi:anthranilate synthase component 2
VILIVDHYDSFTYNLVQLVESLGRVTEVVKSDAESAESLVAHEPDAVILPDEIPVLGVCLGHQALGLSCGGVVDRGTPVHGKASLVFHEGKGILEGVTDPFEAGRYHSLVVLRKTLPDELELTAWTDDGLVMAAQHRTLPRYGVQFHPESILTPEGPRIVENFLALSR